MSEPLPPSVAFLQSEGTPEDFEAFWRQDPIGAAQFATGMAAAQQTRFEGQEELEQLLVQTAEQEVTEVEARLRSFGQRSKDVFRFVERSEAERRATGADIGWTTS